MLFCVNYGSTEVVVATQCGEGLLMRPVLRIKLNRKALGLLTVRFLLRGLMYKVSQGRVPNFENSLPSARNSCTLQGLALRFYWGAFVL